MVAALPAYGSHHLIFEYFHLSKVRHYEIFHTAQKEYGTIHYAVAKERICSWAETVIKVITYCIFIIPLIVFALQIYLAPKGFFEVWSPDKHFQIEDIHRLADQSIGMRHVSSHDQAAVEFDIGISQGCSFNLTFQRAENVFAALPRQLADPTLPEKVKLKALFDYEKAVNGHFENSFRFDAGPMDLGQQYEQILAKLRQSRFLIIDYSVDWHAPCDFKAWSGLGRFPKWDIAPEHIKAIQCSSLNIPLQEPAISSYAKGSKFYDQVIDAWRKDLLELLRKTC